MCARASRGACAFVRADLGLGLCVSPGLDRKTVELSTNFGEGDDAQSNFSFRFAHVFDELALQEEIHAEISSPLVASVLDGYNACVLAYGQTGSGKTHTMLGEHFSDLDGEFDPASQHFKPKRTTALTHDFSSLRKSDGIIPRMLHEIFATIGASDDASRLLVRVWQAGVRCMPRTLPDKCRLCGRRRSSRSTTSK
jgi:hypothetical protein